MTPTSAFPITPLYQVFHNGGVNAARFLDSNHLLTVSQDHLALLWELPDSVSSPSERPLVLSPKRQYKGHLLPVKDLVIDHQSQTFYTCSMDLTVRKWALDQTLPVHSWKAHDKQIMSIDFNGELLLTGSWDSYFGLWYPNGELKVKEQGHYGYMRPARFNKHGTLFATGGKDNIARVWDLNGTQLKGGQFTEWVDALTFSPDDKVIFIGTKLGKVIPWFWKEEGTSTGPIQHRHSARIHSLRIDPSGQYLVAGSRDKLASLYRILPDYNLEFLSYIQYHKSWVYRVDFSADGSLLSLASHDGTATVWDFSQLLSALSSK